MSTTEREQTGQPVRGFTDRALDAHLRTTEEREAMDWLRRWTSMQLGKLVEITNASVHAATLLALLARPIMPKPTPELAKVLQVALQENGWGYWPIEPAKMVLDALYAHLSAPPAPKTKEVEVWRVEEVRPVNGGWLPVVHNFLTKAEADVHAGESMMSSERCIRVTGPHKQTVPA